MPVGHYCSAHNQPRIVLASDSDLNRLIFKFKDGTNIGPDSGHMQQVTFIFNGANHHVEEWTYVQNGKHFLLLSRNHFGLMDVTVSVAVIKGVFVRCVCPALV
jgi:hypothetical protein